MSASLRRLLLTEILTVVSNRTTDRFSLVPAASLSAILLLTATVTLIGTHASLAAESARPEASPRPEPSPDPAPSAAQDAPTVPPVAPPVVPPVAPPADDRPAASAPPKPTPEPVVPPAVPPVQPSVVPPVTPRDNNSLMTSPADTRVPRVVDDEKVTLSFKEELVTSLIPFIQEWTGKAVIVPLTRVQSMKITIVNDKPLPKSEALNLVFQALKINDIGVVETDRVILIDSLTQLTKSGSWIVLPPEADVMSMSAEGNFVVKVFRLKHAKAIDVYERLQDMTLPDYATLAVDQNSNQIVLTGDIGLAKKTQLLINLLDEKPWIPVETRTFAIRFQDASIIADNIRELFEGTGAAGGTRPNRATPQVRGRTAQPGGNPQGQTQQVGLSEQLVVTVLPALNSITVRAEPGVVQEIDRLITQAWDLRPDQKGSPFRTYQLKYTDPLKVQATLQALLEGGSGAGGGARRGTAGARQAIQPGGAGGSGATESVANVFRIEAYPDSNRLVVISKTPENFDWLDEMVKALDQPLDVGLPEYVQLKYASAFEVAEIINVLFAEDGAGSGISRPGEDLTGIDFAGAGGVSASGASGGASGDRGGAGGGAAGEFSFPWQAGRGGAAGEQSPVSPAIGKSRVVPNATQNSLIVLAPPQIQEAILTMIDELDRPGRQVMITAVVAEISLGDGFSFGLRVGDNLTALNGGENAIGGNVDLNLQKGNGATGGENFASPWFDIGTLDVTTSVGFLLQALDSTNDVRILQEPRVFTSDNEEAKFFSGQDITFQQGQTTSDGGGTTSSFETRPVGIGLNVRPRITRELNVAMDIEILLSNLNLSVPQFSNNPVVDRRQTNTKVTVKNGQTIVISGIRREDETNIKRGIPLLGDLPLLGAIFSSTEKKKNVAELVIFVTPVVVDNPDANDHNYNAAEIDRLKNLRKPLEQREKPKGNRGFFDNLRSTNVINPNVDLGTTAPPSPLPVPPEAPLEAPPEAN
ncbi:MAG: secretin N-terminal domain-containing protein [Phycisphaerae bacterium]|nr:secretin N-terminal domain-containing protein [Phycisphaerae bacterium]